MRIIDGQRSIPRPESPATGLHANKQRGQPAMHRAGHYEYNGQEILVSHEARMDIYDFSVRTIDGAEQTLAPYRGEVLLIVNVASKCGFTPQYAGLEALYRKFKDRAFSVLGFPCDQFGQQEPDDEQQIKRFCSQAYAVSFPMFSKIEVNGPGAHPLYQYLKHQQPGILGSEAVKWNFTKFLVDRAGKVLRRYGSIDKPQSIEPDLLAVLD
jgi:glutathione peroxidase